MNPFDANGWTILFYTDFQLQWTDLTAKVVKLKSKLDHKDFVTHPDVKLLKAILLTETLHERFWHQGQNLDRSLRQSFFTAEAT
jgi:hypothetical protein